MATTETKTRTWKAREYCSPPKTWFVEDENGRVIASGNLDESKAVLISAAPELLEACHAFCRACCITRESDEAEKEAILAAYNLARAAIAKAEGR